MSPSIRVGDVVVERPISPMDARAGDVITFKDPRHLDRLLTHRVRHLHVSGGCALFETKGDANNAVENWIVPTDGHISRVLFRIPKLGFALFFLRSRIGQLVLMVIPALILGATFLARIWGPRAREEAHAAADPA